MKVIETKIPGCLILEPEVYEDPRGTFLEAFNEKRFRELTGLEVHFVQDNLSYSRKGVLRGLHFQKGAYAQAKLVQVLKGAVQDVVVDMRVDSPFYGNYLSFELNERNHRQLFIPKGCAHGFLCLSEEAVFMYKCDAFYEPTAEGGILYNDPELNIDWNTEGLALQLHPKDLAWPALAQMK